MQTQGYILVKRYAVQNYNKFNVVCMALYTDGKFRNNININIPHGKIGELMNEAGGSEKVNKSNSTAVPYKSV